MGQVLVQELDSWPAAVLHPSSIAFERPVPPVLVILLIALPVLGFFFWAKAPALYDDHKKTKETNPFLFKLIGYNERYLGDRARWIRHFRMYVVLMSILMFSILLVILVSVRE